MIVDSYLLADSSILLKRIDMIDGEVAERTQRKISKDDDGLDA